MTTASYMGFDISVAVGADFSADTIVDELCKFRQLILSDVEKNGIPNGTKMVIPYDVNKGVHKYLNNNRFVQVRDKTTKAYIENSEEDTVVILSKFMTFNKATVKFENGSIVIELDPKEPEHIINLKLRNHVRVQLPESLLEPFMPFYTNLAVDMNSAKNKSFISIGIPISTIKINQVNYFLINGARVYCKDKDAESNPRCATTYLLYGLGEDTDTKFLFEGEHF